VGLWKVDSVPKEGERMYQLKRISGPMEEDLCINEKDEALCEQLLKYVYVYQMWQEGSFLTLCSRIAEKGNSSQCSRIVEKGNSSQCSRIVEKGNSSRSSRIVGKGYVSHCSRIVGTGSLLRCSWTSREEY
jgi:hypothetical protein